MLTSIPNNIQNFPSHKVASKEFVDEVLTRFGGINSIITEKLIGNLIGSDCWAFGTSDTVDGDIVMFHDSYTTSDDRKNVGKNNRKLVFDNPKCLIEKYNYIHIWMFHPRHENGYKLVINTSPATWKRLIDCIQIYERIIN